MSRRRAPNDVWANAVALAYELAASWRSGWQNWPAAAGLPAGRQAAWSARNSAAWGAGVTLMTGGSSEQVIGQYRKRVASNARRLAPRGEKNACKSRGGPGVLP